MRWNLRMVAAERGVWKSTDLRRVLSDAGLEISAGKMSHLWSGTPISIRLDDLDVICLRGARLRPRRSARPGTEEGVVG